MAEQFQVVGDYHPRSAGVARLGEALSDRIDVVVAGIERRAADSSGKLDAVVEGYFAEVALVSTKAFAEWLKGASDDTVRDTGRDIWNLVGQLAATREAALDDVVKRLLQWRDSITDVLQDLSVHEDDDQALAEALAMLRRNMDVTLIRMGGSFESERQRMHEDLARHENEMTFLATHDPLTGLPNRTLVLDRLDQMLHRASRNKTSAAAIFVDLDNFKAINDSLGHAIGDELLCAFADRLRAVVRESDTIGRIGGDEFVIVAEGQVLASGPELLAERLLEVLKQPFVLEGCADRPLTVSASVGIAVSDGGSPDDVLRDADIAMYRAKRDGKGRYTLFESGMALAAQSSLELEMDLHVALEQQEFSLVYQPIFDLRDMRATGVEALLRWNHPTRETVSPMDFVPVLERCGLMCDVGEWVLQQACTQGAAWARAGTPVNISVNVSGKQLETDLLVDQVRDALNNSGLTPDALTLEVTESTLMSDIEATAHRLALIKELGVRIAIDDFGTGYSSLAHLQRFPIDSLKIDQSFIRQMAQNPEGDTLINTLVQLGKSLSIETLAEGIEQSDQLEHLIEHNCDSGQGFLFARPLESADVEAFLASVNSGARTPEAAVQPPE